MKANVLNRMAGTEQAKNLEAIESEDRQEPAPGIVRSARESCVLDMDVDVGREVKTVHNVAAYIPGENRQNTW